MNEAAPGDPGGPPRLDHAGLEILDEAECEALLRSAVVGRIGFVEDGEVVILPINLGWWQDGLVFSTARGSKMNAATLGRQVAIEVDEWDPATRSGWSVLARGAAGDVTAPREIEALDRLGVHPWVRPDQPKHWVTVRIRSLTGRRTPR